MYIRRGLGIFLLTLLVSVFTMPAFAQFSTSNIAGTVADENGNPVPGATVLIVHQPTGSRKETVSQADGRFRAGGLRVGGPYTVTVTEEGFQGDQFSDIFLKLGDTYELDAQLDQSAAQLGSLEIVGSAQSGLFTPDAKGTQTVITRQTIDNLPTISRSLNDYARLDPRVIVLDEGRQELSVAGQNNRYNNITIDNVPSNDEFGLNPSGLPARNQVISIETIDEFQINTSPYDVAQSNFVGAGINAVTKSGTNEFDGSIYYLFRDDSLIGEDENGNEFGQFDEDVYGFNIGGPLIKDKLFFFASYEHFESTEPGPADFFMPSDAELQRIITASQAFGFDPGTTATPRDLVSEDDQYLVKLDWNIDNNHRATFQYLRTDGTNVVIPGRNGSSFSFGSYFFNNDIERDSFVGILYSDWTPNFSTELNISNSQYSSSPSFNQRLPQIEIENVGGSNSVFLGTERFRHANNLEVDTTTAYFAGEWLTGAHTIKFGIDYKENDTFNEFVFSSLGSYVFDSIDDFEAGIPREFDYRIGSDPSNPFPAADWSYNTVGLFAQDTWEIAYNFSLTYGLRIDLPEVDDSPLFNPLFTDTFGFRNDGTIDGNEVIQPRIGFNWDFSGEYSQQLRGGFGLFQGSAAGVWLSNPFTNPGGNLNVFNERQFADGELAFSADPDNQPIPGAGPGVAAQDVDVLAEDFEQPTVWKANLAYDRELPWGVNMTLEVQHSETENGIQYEHLNLGAPTGNLPDGRLSYFCDTASGSGDRCNADSRFDDVVLLRNSDLGSTTNFTAEFSKTFGDNWNTSLAYTTGRSDDVNSGTSSRAISNWNNRAVFNPNEEVEGVSNYEIRERLIASVQWRDQLFDGLDTSVGVFFESRSGRAFSFTFDNDANGDDIRDNDLLFVPANPGDVQFTDPAEEAAFFDLVNSTPCLSRFSGGTVTRGHCRSPNTKSFDVKISQEIPGFGYGTGEIFFNILNFGNLIDDDWGHIDEVPFEYVAEVVDFEGLTDDGRFIYDLTRTDFTRRQDGSGQSRWSVQLGLKFTF